MCWRMELDGRTSSLRPTSRFDRGIRTPSGEEIAAMGRERESNARAVRRSSKSMSPTKLPLGSTPHVQGKLLTTT